MKPLIILLFLGAAVCFCGCSSAPRVIPSEYNTASVTYEQGLPVLTAQKQNEVAVTYLPDGRRGDPVINHSFCVAVVNRTGENLDFSPEDVFAQSGVSRVGIWRYSQLKKSIERAEMWRQIAIGVAAGSQAFAAAMPQTTLSHGSAYAYNNRGSYAQARYSGVTTTYNPAATAAANAQIMTSAMMQSSLSSQLAGSQLQGIGAMLQRNTVKPGAYVGGVVKLRWRDVRMGQPLVISVLFGGEQYDFIYDVVR
jgi:hypothetical protein